MGVEMPNSAAGNILVEGRDAQCDLSGWKHDKCGHPGLCRGLQRQPVLAESKYRPCKNALGKAGSPGGWMHEPGPVSPNEALR